jgi:hypothetical protein
MQAMSAATGIPLGVLRQARRQGCPLGHHSRFKLLPFLQWWFEKGREIDADWVGRDKRASALLKEVKLERERERLVSMEETIEFMTWLIDSVLFPELDRFARDFPHRAAGKNEVGIHLEMKRQIGITRENLKAAMKLKSSERPGA